MCLISIITPSLNRAAYISEAIQSVIHQDYAHFEHIVVDGGSVDGTLEILHRYPHLRIISEVDRGLYDAINKGIALARGDFVGLLNSDDEYEANIFASVIETFYKNPKSLAVLGGVSIFQESGQGNRKILQKYSPFSQDNFLFNVTQGIPLTNAWFFKREVFKALGLFNINYRYSSDRDFLIRLALKRLSYARLDRVVYHYRQHSGSFTLNEESNAESDFVFEDRDIAEHYLRSNKISSSDRNCLRSWHSRVTTDQALLALSTFRFGKTLKYAMRGCRYDVGWPLYLIQGCIRGTFRVVRNNIFSKPVLRA